MATRGTQRVADRWDIQDQKSSYFTLFDSRAKDGSRDWESWSRLFTPDVHVEIDGYGFVDRESFVEGVSTLFGSVKTAHSGHLMQVVFPEDDERAATSRCSMRDTLVFDDADPLKPVGIEGAGRYDETWRRNDDGVWRISQLVLVLYVVLALPGGFPKGGPWPEAPTS